MTSEKSLIPPFCNKKTADASDLKKVIISGYKQKSRRKIVYILFFFVATMVSGLLDVLTGPAALPMQTALEGLINPGTLTLSNRIILWDLRLPVSLTAILVGATLACAGLQMQTILNNPLASPYTLGLSSAAGFGAALMITIGNITRWAIPSQYVIPLGAFVFSLSSALLLYAISTKKHASVQTIILSGIALSFLFSALQGILQFIASADQNQAIVFWLFGSLHKTDWMEIGIIFLVFIISFPLFCRNIWKLTALRMGDDTARSLGVNISKIRLQMLFLISIMTATAVSFVGTIGFIGLVAPHIARMITGEEQRYLLPLTACIGAFILSTTSLVSELILPKVIFPVGLITSLIGVPFFVWMILSTRREFWC